MKTITNPKEWKTRNIYTRLPRDVSEIVCPECDSIAYQVACTPAERKIHGCGRLYDCCSRAFVCKKCKTRIVGRCEAPDME